MLIIDDPLVHVETFGWVLDESVKFVSPVAIVGETFQVNDERVW